MEATKYESFESVVLLWANKWELKWNDQLLHNKDTSKPVRKPTYQRIFIGLKLRCLYSICVTWLVYLQFTIKVAKKVRCYCFVHSVLGILKDGSRQINCTVSRSVLKHWHVISSLHWFGLIQLAPIIFSLLCFWTSYRSMGIFWHILLVFKGFDHFDLTCTLPRNAKAGIRRNGGALFAGNDCFTYSFLLGR